MVIGPGSGFILWSFPGDPPDQVEYELTAPDVEPHLVRAPINEAITFDRAYSVRYRGVWGDKPGAWSDDPFYLQWVPPTS